MGRPWQPYWLRDLLRSYAAPLEVGPYFSDEISWWGAPGNRTRCEIVSDRMQTPLKLDPNFLMKFRGGAPLATVL